MSFGSVIKLLFAETILYWKISTKYRISKFQNSSFLQDIENAKSISKFFIDLYKIYRIRTIKSLLFMGTLQKYALFSFHEKLQRFFLVFSLRISNFFENN